MKALLIISTILSLVACKVPKEINNNPPQAVYTMITATIGEFEKSSDPVEIIGCRISGNKLFLDIRFTGGCNEHEFKMIGSPSIAKSLPPIRAIQLVHHASGDQCKKAITETIEVDIKALAYQQTSGSTIYLTLEGWKEQLEYTFE